MWEMPRPGPGLWWKQTILCLLFSIPLKRFVNVDNLVFVFCPPEKPYNWVEAVKKKTKPGKRTRFREYSPWEGRFYFSLIMYTIQLHAPYCISYHAAFIFRKEQWYPFELTVSLAKNLSVRPVYWIGVNLGSGCPSLMVLRLNWCDSAF